MKEFYCVFCVLIILNQFATKAPRHKVITKLENIYFRYQGTEKIKIRRFGEFDCIKLSVFLVAGSVFRGGEHMNIWITNDKNHIPLYVESPIIIGSVKAKILSVKGNKYKLTSRVK